MRSSLLFLYNKGQRNAHGFAALVDGCRNGVDAFIWRRAGGGVLLRLCVAGCLHLSLPIRESWLP